MCESENETLGKQLKIVFLGDANVGKTSLIRRICFDEFSRQYNQTVGAEFYMKSLELSKDKEVSLRFFDVGGSEFSGLMLKNYLYNSDIILLIYDLTNPPSYENLSSWIDVIKEIVSNPVTVAVCANKIDMVDKRSVKQNRTERFLLDSKLNFYLSAKTGENVNKCLNNLVAGHLGVDITKTENSEKHVDIPKMRNSSGQPNRLPSTAHPTSTVCSMQ